MNRCLTVLLSLILGTAALVGLSPPTSAHSELEAASPKPNSHLKAAPSEVRMTFSETPSPDSVIKVTDGCGDTVVQDLSVDAGDLVASIAGGEPGKWHARFHAISAEDGHLTDGAYAFDVAGEKDCSKGGDSNDNGSTDGGSNAAGGDGGSSFPVVPVVIGAIVLVGVGLVVRRASAG